MTTPLHSIDPASEVARISPDIAIARAMPLMRELEEVLQEMAGAASDTLIQGITPPREALERIYGTIPAALGRLRAIRVLLGGQP